MIYVFSRAKSLIYSMTHRGLGSTVRRDSSVDKQHDVTKSDFGAALVCLHLYRTGATPFCPYIRQLQTPLQLQHPLQLDIQNTLANIQSKCA